MIWLVLYLIGVIGFYMFVKQLIPYSELIAVLWPLVLGGILITIVYDELVRIRGKRQI